MMLELPSLAVLLLWNLSLPLMSSAVISCDLTCAFSPPFLPSGTILFLLSGACFERQEE